LGRLLFLARRSFIEEQSTLPVIDNLSIYQAIILILLAMESWLTHLAGFLLDILYKFSVRSIHWRIYRKYTDLTLNKYSPHNTIPIHDPATRLDVIASSTITLSFPLLFKIKLTFISSLHRYVQACWFVLSNLAFVKLKDLIRVSPRADLRNINS
jgi:hypothetical protein